jgi:asparagine synthase (glutamine-hydrolysing)
MCGITGFWAPGGVEPQAAAALGTAMAARIAHRGPDDHGVWCDAPAGLVLAHRRLSILDLSPAGHQPMSSASGRFVMVFNGEIYNFQELRAQVEGACSTAPAWRGHSDTEVLLEGFELWGVEATIARAVGMFAIAAWDRQERELYLARDRMGEKPLYYGRQRGVFLFGSELKALAGHPSFEREVNRDAVALLLGHNYIPAPYSIWSGIAKLPPAHCLRLKEGQSEPVIRPYWSLAEVAAAGQAAPFAGSDDEAVAELERLLGEAVGLQMVADVPLGAFLSGGVDSSTIVALMQSRSPRPVRTFTIGFDEPAWNEAGHAKAVAQHLGTDHTELYVSPADVLGVVPNLPRHYDEPFADASQIPTLLVAGLARRHVTVSLSGDAGDELFGGYDRYFLARGLWDRLARIPAPLRRSLAGCLDAAAGRTDAAGLRTRQSVPGRWRGRPLDVRFRQASELLRCADADDVFRSVVSHWRSPSAVVRGAVVQPTVLSPGAPMPAVGGFEHRMMYLDAMSYLCDDVLCKVDRAAMTVSLETRVPLLDHRVVEFAWRLPLHMKVRDGRGKWILRQVLDRHVPRDLIDRPKVGFGVPLASWLRGELREWGADLLAPDRLAREGFFRPEPVLQRWNEHQSRVQNWHYSLWSILMFQAWLEDQRRSAD